LALPLCLAPVVAEEGEGPEGVIIWGEAFDKRRKVVTEGLNERGYQVTKSVRDLCVFAQHDLLKDPPFSHVDLVSCRNLLIYMNRAAQNRVMEVMHFALNPGGYLLLGSSESVDGSSDLFASADKEARLYQSRAVPARLTIPIAVRPAALGRQVRAQRQIFRGGQAVLGRAVSPMTHRATSSRDSTARVISSSIEATIPSNDGNAL